MNQIADVLDYVGGLKAAVPDLDDTFYGERECIRSGYRAVAKVISQVENAERKSWRLFLGKKPATDGVLSMESIYTEEIRRRCPGVYCLHKLDIYLYGGVMELLTKLRCHGYRLGVVTDGRPEGRRAKIRVLGLGKYMDYIVVTDELGSIKYKKPSEAAFIRIADKLNVAFTQMYYVGDNTKKDFSVPLELGMRTVWFRGQDGLY